MIGEEIILNLTYVDWSSLFPTQDGPMFIASILHEGFRIFFVAPVSQFPFTSSTGLSRSTLFSAFKAF